MKDRVLDSQLAQSLIGRDSPNELNVDNEEITRIGNLCEVSFLRKLNLSFNPVQQIDGLDQLPQLRELYAYSCGIRSLEIVSSLPRLEVLFLQQNLVAEMPRSLLSLAKLKELRLDKNRLTAVQHLKSCAALRRLDLSANSLQSLDGVSGLQSLKFLKVSNNAIKSLQPLKGLPSLLELDVSHNQLKSIEGIQQLPALESFRADHNQIFSCFSVQTVQTLRAAATLSTASANSSGASKQAIGSTNKRSAANAKGSKADEKDSALPKIGPMPLQECFLANNRLKSLEGLEVFSKSLETLDVSGNYLSAVAEAITVVTQLSSLSELHVRGNAIADSEESLNELISAVANKCPAIRAVDGFSFVSDGHLTAFDPSDRAPLARRTGSASSSVEETQLRREDSKEFHTWADDGGGSSSTVLEDRSARRNGTHYSSDSDEDQVSGELETLEENAASSIADQPEGIIAPKLSLKDIKTPEEIAAMETKFTTLLQQCRETLAQTVFMFSDPAQTLSELFDIQSTSNVVHKPTQPPPTNERETLIDKDTEKMRLDLMQKVIQTVSKPEQALPSIAISNIPEKLGSMLTDTDNLPGSSTSRSAKSVKSNYSSTSKKSASASTSSLLGLGDFSLGVEPLKYHGSGLSRHGTKLSKGSKKKAGSNSVGKLRGAVSQSLDMHDADTPSTTIPKMRAIEGTSIMESTEEVEHLAKGSPQYQTTVTRVSTTLDNVNNNESEESDSSSVANSEAYQGEARRKEEFRNKVSEYNTNQIGLHQIHEQSEDDEDDGIQKRYSSTEQRNKPSPSYRTLANGSLIQVGFDSRSLRILRHSDDTTPTGPALLNDLTSRSNPCEALTLEPRENEDNFGCNSKRRGATVVSAADSPPIYRSYSDSFLRMEPSPVAMSKTNIGAHSSGIAIAKHCIPQQDHDSQSVESLSGTVYSYQSKQHDSNSKLSKFAGDVAFASAFLPFEDNTPDRGTNATLGRVNSMLAAVDVSTRATESRLRKFSIPVKAQEAIRAKEEK